MISKVGELSVTYLLNEQQVKFTTLIIPNMIGPKRFNQFLEIESIKAKP
jgi:hypothetical protein